MRLSVGGCGRQIIRKVIFVELWCMHWREQKETSFFKSRLCCGLKRRSEVMGKVTRVGLCRDPGRSEGASVLKSNGY